MTAVDSSGIPPHAHLKPYSAQMLLMWMLAMWMVPMWTTAWGHLRKTSAI